MAQGTNVIDRIDRLLQARHQDKGSSWYLAGPVFLDADQLLNVIADDSVSSSENTSSSPGLSIPLNRYNPQAAHPPLTVNRRSSSASDSATPVSSGYRFSYLSTAATHFDPDETNVFWSSRGGLGKALRSRILEWGGTVPNRGSSDSKENISKEMRSLSYRVEPRNVTINRGSFGDDDALFVLSHWKRIRSFCNWQFVQIRLPGVATTLMLGAAIKAALETLRERRRRLL
ncbi:hypothetical protein F5887DRAFT_1212555 [Amanita rubescens]|nr:hypothetical protein F5887DRAFT_1212555 [Amanita rubescens]